MTESDVEFLQEHVFGQWRFSRRLFTNGRQEKYNFSEQGIEDMKNIVINFDADRINIVSGLDQETFHNSQDAYVFADGGGFFSTEMPVYRMEKNVDTHNILLHPEFATANFSEKEELVLVRCTLGYLMIDQSTMEDEYNGYPCGYLDYLYIDPKDTDTMYVSFGGLWELKRVDEEYPKNSETVLFTERADEKWKYEMEEKDLEFLREHLFGQWEFSRQIVELDEGVESNFSDLGVEELKEVRLVYDKNHVRTLFLRPYLTDPKDMYLFGLHGGLSQVNQPCYHIDTDVTGNEISLTGAYRNSSYSVQFPEEKNLIRIYYNLGYDETVNPHVSGRYAGSNIYIDLDDTDTIYLDFCGLWEMKRDVEKYSTNRKYTGKG